MVWYSELNVQTYSNSIYKSYKCCLTTKNRYLAFIRRRLLVLLKHDFPRSKWTKKVYLKMRN